MITTVIFDMDDTLYDEADYCKSGFKAVADFLGKSDKKNEPEIILQAFEKQFSSGNRTKIFNLALEGLNIAFDNELIGKLIELYRNHIPEITLPDESREVLEKLKNRYILALLTDGYLPGQKLKVQALNIEKYFKCIVYTEQLGREFWKPSPAGFEKILETLKAEPKNTVYVADNEKKDFLAPNKLGIHSIQILRPNRLHITNITNSDTAAQFVLHKISRLPSLICNL